MTEFSLNDLFGEADLLSKTPAGDISSVAVGSLVENEVVGIYFSAHWCPPCRFFTPQLISKYKEIVADGKAFDVVFVSSDSDQKAFDDYYADMPWKALSFSDRETKEKISSKYEVRGIPTLVLIDPRTGEVISKEGRLLVGEYGSEAFPFTDDAVVQYKNEKLMKASAKFSESFGNGFQGFGAGENLLMNTGEKISLKSLMEYKHVALAFGNNDSSPNPFVEHVVPVLNKLRELVAETNGEDALQIVYVPWKAKGDDTDLRKKITFPALPKDSVNEKMLTDIFGEIESPAVYMVTGDGRRVLTGDVVRSIYTLKEKAFPWTDSALKQHAEEKARFKDAVAKNMKSKLQGLAGIGRDYLVRNDGSQIPISQIAENDIVGIFFSAPSWCGPCKMFEPQLSEVYKQCQKDGKSFEVIFVSADNSKGDFDKFFKGMPWLALPFEERDLATALEETYEVNGYPTLLLFNGNGTLLEKNGRGLVGTGAQDFPWGLL